MEGARGFDHCRFTAGFQPAAPAAGGTPKHLSLSLSSFSGPVVCNSGNVFVSIYIAMYIHVYMLRQDNDYVELFAGSGQVSASLRQAWQLWVHVDSVYLAGFSLGKDGAGGTTFELMDNPLIFDLTSNSGFALALNEIRRLRPGACAIVAICCESYSAMCLMLHWFCSSWSLKPETRMKSVAVLENKVPCALWEKHPEAVGKLWVRFRAERKPVDESSGATIAGSVLQRSQVSS